MPEVILIGLAFLPRAKRSYLYTPAHNVRSLVQRVAYISGPGHPEGGNPYGGGPSMLVTNLCVFTWNRETEQWKLDTLHPGVTLDQVKEATGFEFEHSENPSTTNPPTENELAFIRTIDPNGYLRGYND
ncbi:MAG: hypothetical protein ACXAD7_22565 [Candidatus Kariarchaeaceae archaeon]|jgi:glutaconate CoA-transferase subunit B